MFPPVMGLNQSTLNDLVLNILRAVDKMSTNVITPNKPWWAKMRELGGGAIETRDPNIHGMVERLMYSTPDQIQTLSRSRDTQDISYDTPEVETEARYDYFLDVIHLTLGTFERLNTMGETAIVDHIGRKKKSLEIAQKNALNDRFWNGRVSGSEVMFGLNDVLNRISMSTDPAKGAIGEINTADTGASFWRPNVVDFGGAYKIIDSGTTRTNLLNGPTNSLLSLWILCSNNDTEGDGHMEDGSKQSGQEGEPDFLLCNETLYQQMLDLVDNRLLFQNKEAQFQTGIIEPLYRSAMILRDPSVPTLVADEGQGYFYNTNAAKFVFAKGIERSWGNMEPVPGKTAVGWPMMTQYGMVYNDLRKLGLIHGIEDVL